MEVSEYMNKLMEFSDGLLQGRVLTDSIGKYYGNVTIRIQEGEIGVYEYKRTTMPKGVIAGSK